MQSNAGKKNLELTGRHAGGRAGGQEASPEGCIPGSRSHPAPRHGRALPGTPEGSGSWLLPPGPGLPLLALFVLGWRPKQRSCLELRPSSWPRSSPHGMAASRREVSPVPSCEPSQAAQLTRPQEPHRGTQSSCSTPGHGTGCLCCTNLLHVEVICKVPSTVGGRNSAAGPVPQLQVSPAACGAMQK